MRCTCGIANPCKLASSGSGTFYIATTSSGLLPANITTTTDTALTMASSAPLLPSDQPPPAPPPLPNRSFIYPLSGIAYLFKHRPLHPPVISRILPLTAVSILTLFLMFTLLYIPHLIVLKYFKSPFPAFNAMLMILSESATLVAFLAESLLTEFQLVDIFDIILLHPGPGTPFPVQRKLRWMVESARVVNPDGTVGKHKLDPYLKFKESFRTGVYCLLALPLNFIPVVGWPLFVLVQAYVLGPLSHYRWFQLMGWGDKRRRAFVKEHWWRYWAFGIAHVGLQMVPVASIFFLFSTGTGAGVWALEAEKRLWVLEGCPEDWGVDGKGCGRREELASGPWWKLWGRKK